ncbi:MAG: SAM-dependent chlorinase/fluorinase [Planctomycetia bacterium]|nr:SAM-dependent chlorinase/fluorinase [Planctomycetia bacterium]
MPRPIITLTTDFGTGSPYVAAMKGVILSINPEAAIVDITHAIEPQNIFAAAQVLAEATPRFPAGSIHVAVVDPGVGSGRGIVWARFVAGNSGSGTAQQYVAPDNGLLTGLARRGPPDRIVAVTRREHWLAKVSATFHGRDIMAPVAAKLSLGLMPDELGPSQSELVLLVWPEVEVVPGKVRGAITAVDSFGNLITNITREMLADAPTGEQTVITCDEHQTQGIFNTYADQPEMTLLALFGSSGLLELAIVGDSAKIMLGVNVGTPVEVAW